MATRMQQRRGTAAQWISINSGNGPILNAGEIGYESDTNKFKIGDGASYWINLDYFIDANSTVNPSFGSSITFEGATANAFETTLEVTDPTAARTITLPNATGTVVLADGSGNLTVSGITTITPAAGTTATATTGAGYMGLPQNSTTTGAYTIAAADAGKHIYSTATRTITINSNANLALPIGTTLTFISGVGATTTIAITTDTMNLAGTGTTGSRTLAAYGIATAIKIASTTWIISGSGLT